MDVLRRLRIDDVCYADIPRKGTEWLEDRQVDIKWSVMSKEPMDDTGDSLTLQGQVISTHGSYAVVSCGGLLCKIDTHLAEENIAEKILVIRLRRKVVC